MEANVNEIRKELEELINRHSLENGSDTPDFILAKYLMDCLKAFDNATAKRSEWYNHKTKFSTETLESEQDT